MYHFFAEHENISDDYIDIRGGDVNHIKNVIRLKAGDAKWIYDNCDLGTKVTIFESNKSGPFPKPTSVQLDYSHTWDPTDPTMVYKCRENGCHKGIAW